jgi:hypothetical protein
MTMTAQTVQLSYEHARRLLVNYHFAPTDLPGVFERLEKGIWTIARWWWEEG